ncbi:hypothetical protein ACSTIP_00495, partial [Vibrio parahaemolyticus]
AHLGPIATGMERGGQGSDRGDTNRAIAAENADRAAVRAQVIDLEAERAKRLELEQRKAELAKLEKVPLAELRRVLQETSTPAKFADYVQEQ